MAGAEVLAIPFGVSLAIWSLLAIVLHGMASLVVRASGFKKYTSKQMLISLAVAGIGCGASAQIVSSCHGVSEQYCIITHDKLCILLKYN